MKLFHPRMDLSSPTDTGSGLYEDMQTSGEDAYGRSLSSESSSGSGMEIHRRPGDRDWDRQHLRMFAVIVQSFCDILVIVFQFYLFQHQPVKHFCDVIYYSFFFHHFISSQNFHFCYFSFAEREFCFGDKNYSKEFQVSEFRCKLHILK